MTGSKLNYRHADGSQIGVFESLRWLFFCENTMEYANLSPESKQKLSDFFKDYFASDYYKNSQKYLRDVVRKNEQARYNLPVLQPTQEK